MHCKVAAPYFLECTAQPRCCRASPTSSALQGPQRPRPGGTGPGPSPGPSAAPPRYLPPSRRRTQRTQFTLSAWPRRAATARLTCGTDRQHRASGTGPGPGLGLGLGPGPPPTQSAPTHRRVVEDDVVGAAEGEEAAPAPGHGAAGRAVGAAGDVTERHGRRHLGRRRVRDPARLPWQRPRAGRGLRGRGLRGRRLWGVGCGIFASLAPFAETSKVSKV